MDDGCLKKAKLICTTPPPPPPPLIEVDIITLAPFVSLER